MTTTTYKTAAEIPQAQFGVGACDTRWDVYPQAAEPPRVVARNWRGLWVFDQRSGVWSLSPVVYLVYAWDLTAEDAERLVRN